MAERDHMHAIEFYTVSHMITTNAIQQLYKGRG